MRLRGDAAALAVFGLVAALPLWLGDRRPAPGELRAAHELVVTSSADDGPGSLREAVLDADRAPGRARIVVATPRVVLTAPLPALVNPAGVVLDGGDAGCEIDARQVDGGVIDVAAPGSIVRGLTIRGTAGDAIRVRADRVRLTELALEDCGEGVHAVAGVRDLTVERSRFRANGVGLRLDAPGPGTVIRDNVFERHDDAAVWAVAPRWTGESNGGLEVRGNRFTEDRMSLVIANVPATVEDNELDGAFEAAVYLIGRGAVVRRNRIRGALKTGVYGERPVDVLVADNELDRNQVAVLMAGGERTVVRGNRFHANVVGLATVFESGGGDNLVADNLLVGQRHDALLVVGASPVVRGNRALYNQQAGLRILDVGAVVAAPRLEANVLAGNGVEGPLRGAFREAAEDESP